MSSIKYIDASNKPPEQKLKIDETSITVNPEKDDPTHKAAIRECMFHFAKQQEYPFSQYGYQSAKGGRYETGLRIYAPNELNAINGKWSSKIYALLQCNPKNELGGYLRLEWNPARWSVTGTAHLFGVLSAVMQHTSQFDKLLEDAKVTRLDVAIDILGIRPDDCHWELAKGIYRDPVTKNGPLETLYLGNRNAAQHKGMFRIYDKGVETGNSAIDLTRIERDYRHNKLRLGDLAQLPNLFSTLRCLDIRAALDSLGIQGIPPMWRGQFCDSLALRGSRFALDRIENPTLRSKIKKAINTSVPAFWDLDAMWSLWPDVVASAFAHEPVPPHEHIDGGSAL